MVVNQLMDKIDSEFWHLPRDLNQLWFSADNLIMFADAIHAKRAALNNTWGFIDGTVRPISRPRIHQRIVYKWQQKTTCSKVSVSYYPKRNDGKFIWSNKGETSWCYNGENFMPYGHFINFFFGTSARKTLHIWRSSIPFKMVFVSTIQGSTSYTKKKAFNDSMAKVRVSVE